MHSRHEMRHEHKHGQRSNIDPLGHRAHRVLLLKILRHVLEVQHIPSRVALKCSSEACAEINSRPPSPRSYHATHALTHHRPTLRLPATVPARAWHAARDSCRLTPYTARRCRSLPMDWAGFGRTRQALRSRPCPLASHRSAPAAHEMARTAVRHCADSDESPERQSRPIGYSCGVSAFVCLFVCLFASVASNPRLQRGVVRPRVLDRRVGGRQLELQVLDLQHRNAHCVQTFNM